MSDRLLMPPIHKQSSKSPPKAKPKSPIRESSRPSAEMARLANQGMLRYFEHLKEALANRNAPPGLTTTRGETAEREADAWKIPLRSPALSGGRPLDQATRSYFEARFGHDLSRIRVHADAETSWLATRLNAKAFTVGQHIVFGEGQHAPETPAGRHLLAHELTHVVQQTAAPAPSRPVSDPSNAAEREADVAARRVVAGERVQVASSPSALLQRSRAETAPLASTGHPATDADIVEHEADLRHFFENIIASFGLFGDSDLPSRVDLVMSNTPARAFAAQHGAPGLGTLDDTRSGDSLDVPSAFAALAAHPERYTLAAMMERRNLSIRSALIRPPAKAQQHFSLSAPSFNLQPQRLGVLVPPLEIPSQEDLAEFDLLRGRIADLHGTRLRTVHSYLAHRRSVFGSDANYHDKTALADQEFDANQRLMMVEMEGGTIDAKKALYRWVREGFLRSGVTNPIQKIRSGETPALRSALANVQAAVGRVSLSGRFVPRPRKSEFPEGLFKLGTISEHATGKAVDIQAKSNPFLSRAQWAHIESVTNTQIDRSARRWNSDPGGLWQDIKDMSTAFAALNHAAEIANLVGSAAARPLIALHQNFAQGFLTLAKNLVVALHGEGFVWGATFSTGVDLQHFELP
jgi:hypothetical protein